MSGCTETESGRQLDIPKKLTIKKEPTMTQIKKVLYTAKTHTTGGRKAGCLEALMAAWTLSFRLLTLPVPAPTPSSFWLPVGRPASYRRSRSWPPE